MIFCHILANSLENNNKTIEIPTLRDTGKINRNTIEWYFADEMVTNGVISELLQKLRN